MENIQLGLLDFGHRLNLNSMERIEDVLNYAVQADRLGYSRFWLTEHHNPLATQAWSSPEMLLPILAGMTQDIRIGVAGVLLPVHMPYRVALNFKLLNNLYPGRIDLGLARGFPLIEKVGTMLHPMYKKENAPALFEEHIVQLTQILYNEKEQFQENHFVIPPYAGQVPELWYLGRSYSYIDKALELKLNYCRSLFHTGASLEYELDKLRSFREKFEALHHIAPKVSVAVAGYLSDSIHKSEQNSNLIKEKYAQNQSDFNNIATSYEKFYDLIYSWQQLYGVDEFIFLDTAEDCHERLETCHRLSELFHLKSHKSSTVEKQAESII